MGSRPSLHCIHAHERGTSLVSTRPGSARLCKSGRWRRARGGLYGEALRPPTLGLRLRADAHVRPVRWAARGHIVGQPVPPAATQPGASLPFPPTGRLPQSHLGDRRAGGLELWVGSRAALAGHQDRLLPQPWALALPDRRLLQQLAALCTNSTAHLDVTTPPPGPTMGTDSRSLRGELDIRGSADPRRVRHRSDSHPSTRSGREGSTCDREGGWHVPHRGTQSRL